MAIGKYCDFLKNKADYYRSLTNNIKNIQGRNNVRFSLPNYFY